MSDEPNTLDLTIAVTTAWLDNASARIRPDDLPALMQSIHAAIDKLVKPDAVEPMEAPATDKATTAAIRKSLRDPNYIVSFINGRPYRFLGRHLTANGFTAAQYRERYGLPAFYPTVAPAYSASRSETAKRIGLGRKPGQKVPTEAVEGKPASKGRKSVADAKRAARAHLGGI